MTAAIPTAGHVRVSVSDGTRIATVDVDRDHLERWPDLAVATVDALLHDLDRSAAPTVAR